MFRKTPIMIAIALLFAASALARSEEPKKGLNASAAASITATVVKIDSAKRIISLKGPDGDIVDVSVSPAVKRFAEIKVGDKLNVTYREALVISVAKADSDKPLGMSVEESVAPVKDSAKPAGVATSRITATVAVVSVDLQKREIKIHTADGSSETYRIRDPKNVEGIKTGDKITIVYEEAVAVEIK